MTVIVKAPNQQIKDQIVNCEIGWTVGQLKEHLSDVYPSKPERASQKLIYSGQLLNDTTCLKDVLRHCSGQENQTYIVHLVCAMQKMPANTPATTGQTAENANATMRSTTEQSRLNNASNVQNQTQSANNVAMQHAPAQLYSTQYFDPRNSQQMAWMQQAYTHYFTQYMQLMAAQGIQLQTSIPYVQQMNVNTNDSVQNPHANNLNNNNNNNNVGDEQQQQPAAQEVDANGGNNGAGEDGAFNRDWLDVSYMLSRIIVLFTIVYFYSSPLRFLIVTFLGFAMYLYQGGFFRVQPILLPENNNARVDRVENNNQVLQNEAAAPQPVVQQQNGPVPTIQAEARTNANEEHEEERPGALAFTWMFFSTFFASLIPDQPNVI